jgi:phenylalanyl-tRNA synthetase beta chain
MKVSENWLREWVNPQLTTQQLAEQMTMAGLEVDSLTPAAPRFEGVVIGKILSVEPHPNAERLSVCQVEAGLAEPLTIVTNATVTPDLCLAVAKVGAHLPGIHPNRETLSAADMRGLQSQGMLCSGEELGLDLGHKGLWTFDKDAPVGQDLWEVLQLTDTIIEVDLTPNRGDCSSVLGLARELSVLNNMPLTPVKIAPVVPVIEDKPTVDIRAYEECPRYVARIIKGIQPTSTPLVIQEKLRRSDIRAIHPVVDILNYVMLELGQPMHAFDANKLKGDIIVRSATPGEKITVLGGQVIELTETTLVIADERHAIAIAGIMGGEESAVSADSVDILLESALFSHQPIAGKARQLGLHTDSSYRYERGVDPQLQVLAIERATRLIMEYCQGQPGPVVETVYRNQLPAKAPIIFRPARFHQVIGDHIKESKMVDVLESLRCVVTQTEDLTWKVEPPSFRYDINEEIDLIEEIARIVGYSALKTAQPISRLEFDRTSQTEVGTSRIKRILVDLGYQEAITYSFVDEASQQGLFPESKPLKLLNPISSDMGVMRVSLWPGLLNAVRYNQNRQQTRMKLFEVGQCFIQEKGTLIQEDRLGGVVCGEAFAEHWDLQKRKVDFFDVKGHLETLFKTLGLMLEGLTFKAGGHPCCHPGQCADIYWLAKRVGVIGKLHPKAQQDWGLDGAIYVYEIKLDALKHTGLPSFFRPSRFPENRRDIAVIVDEDVSSETLIKQVRKDAGELLQQTKVFDVYMGKGIEPGQKSVAMGLILQHPSRTLVDEEVDTLVRNVVSGLEREFNAKLRD